MVPLLLGDGEVPLLLGDRGAVAGLRGVAAVHLEVSGGDLRAVEQGWMGDLRLRRFTLNVS